VVGIWYKYIRTYVLIMLLCHNFLYTFTIPTGTRVPTVYQLVRSTSCF
jgi:hypothetical protein